MPDLIKAWELDRGTDLEGAERVKRERAAEPDMELLILSSREGSVGVQVVSGTLRDPKAALYLSDLGLFELARTEIWPPLPGERGPRFLLTLRALPRA